MTTTESPASNNVRGACHHDCPDTCVWDVTVVDGRAVRLRGNADHPTTRGQLCPKVNRFLDRVYHTDRIRRPLRRSGRKGTGAFEPISWDAALDEIATRLGSLVADGEGTSILPFSFDGTQGVIQKGVMADRFFDAVGASDIRRDLCGVTAWLGAADVSGLPFGIDPEELADAKNIILWGTNTLLTNRHLWPVIEQARSGGARLTVVDPVRTPTAARADEFLQIAPGTDVALVLAMVHVLDADGLIDQEWIEGHTSGWDALRTSALEMPVDRAGSITGIAPDRIVALAHDYVRRRPSAIRTLVGPEHRSNGRDIMRAVALLPAVTGAWRDRGGGLARSTQIYFETALNYPTPVPRARSFNMARIGEVLNDVGLDPPIKALIVHNSNPAVICPDQNSVVRGLERDDLFTVVIEQFMTDTARFADIVLPTTTQIEHLDLAIAWGHLYLALNRPAIEPVGEALPNTEIFRRLATRMGLDDPGFGDSDETLVRQLLDSTHPWLDGITYESIEAHSWQRLAVPTELRPHVDASPAMTPQRLTLGPLEHSSPPEQAADPGALHPLVLISRKQHTAFLNANYACFDEHLPPERVPRLQMDPVDASARGLGDGDAAVVFNDRGSLTLTVHVSSDLQPGVVAIPFGWWHRHTPDQRGVNVLTNPTTPSDDVGSAAFHDTLVEVRVHGG